MFTEPYSQVVIVAVARQDLSTWGLESNRPWLALVANLMDLLTITIPRARFSSYRVTDDDELQIAVENERFPKTPILAPLPVVRITELLSQETCSFCGGSGRYVGLSQASDCGGCNGSGRMITEGPFLAEKRE